MSTYTWTIPSSPSPSSAANSTPSATPLHVFGFYDQEIDPASRDYIDEDDGSWSETEDSRTAVMLQLDIEYGQWFADPEAGSRIKEMLRSGDPITTGQLVDEVKRALQLLVDDGIIADLQVGVVEEDDARGYVGLELTYTDRASGHVVDVAYSPF